MGFLLENPFILVVIIGIISSFYKQMKGTEKESQKRKQPKPFVNGQSTEKEKSKPLIDFDFGEIQKRFERPQTEAKKPVEKEGTASRRGSETTDLFEEYSPPKTSRQERPSTGRLNQPKKENAERNVSVPRVSNQTLRDAVVWAEILGPPRAKQIHNRRKVNS